MRKPKPATEKLSKSANVRMNTAQHAAALALAPKDGLGAWFFEGRRKEIEAALAKRKKHAVR